MLDYTDDEYDEYNLSLDADLLPYLAELPPSPHADGPSSQPKASRPRPISTHSEFSEYDFSEFTAAELASFDTQLDRHSPSTSSANLCGGHAEGQTSAATSKSHGGTSSGPAVEIELEGSSTNHDACLKAPGAQGQMCTPQASSSANRNTAAAGNSGSPKYTESSAYHRWRRYTDLLSVSDLVGPAWCEVQFWYGLLGKRSRTAEQRPESFITDTGKTIKVNKAKSIIMEKIQNRGVKIHKQLEKQIHPEEIKVEPATKEERWGLRIVRMINAIESLVAIGKCREMPVFGILQDQIITGIIDEIERKPIAPYEQESPWESRSESPSSNSGGDRKRSRPTVPAAPSKHNAKKARRTPSPPQTSITAFFSSSSAHPDHGAERPQAESMCVDDFSSSSVIGEQEPRPQTPPAAPSSPQFALYLSDNKTRQTPTVPPHEDTLGTRLQLMFYHKLLTGLLLPPGSDGAVDFDALWKSLGLSPTRQFSSKFQQEAGLDANVSCLAELQVLWHTAVDFLAIEGISNTLTLVYRRQHRVSVKKAKKARKAKKAKKSPAAKMEEVVTDATAADILTKQDTELAEFKDTADVVAPVVQATVDSPAHSEDRIIVDDPGTSTMHATNGLNGAGSSKRPSFSDSFTDMEIQWAIEASLLPKSVQNSLNPTTEFIPEEAVSSSGESSSEEGSSSGDESTKPARAGSIIGIKSFAMDHEMLDNYLSDILRWWYGKRKPHGVGVEMTRRCRGCEYREDCEWRESKANEAMMKAHRAETS